MKILSVIGDVKAKRNLYQEIDEKCILDAEVSATGMIGKLGVVEGTEQSSKEAVEYFKKCLDLSKEIGENIAIEAAKSHLSHAKSLQGEGSYKQQTLKQRRDLYEYYVGRYGEHSPHSIRSGLDLALGLMGNYHSIEAERLLVNLATQSRRVHGPEHALTKSAESDLQECKVRCISVMHKGRQQGFQVLQHEGDEETLVLKGPMTKDGYGDETFRVTAKAIHLDYNLGTPVICHGLKKAHHLNGKIGDLRQANKEAKRFEVHFEDPKLKPCLVKPENVRILFELPGNDRS
eukprot:CAMPEP_0181089974 /NCGR_PEP_ID=MMETSP1071-20121207/7587_1 /TAXON_ID=35127 /ORGANISM="Thalassiosira sp., Strain NH16" /LENGTH=289 /DNA_ID=CAMNT_0023171955 /DNA_START=233 /DNA_END=1102 /DNA_ORIENTATION=-